MLQNASFPEEGKRIAEDLTKVNVTIISNGSFQPQIKKSLDAATSIIESHGENPCIVKAPTHKHEEEVTDAYQAELSVIPVGVLSILTICYAYHLNDGHASMGCDGDSAVISASLSKKATQINF